MAVCDICNGEMLEVKGCLQRDYIINGKEYQAMVYIDEHGTNQRCGDCNAEIGQPHHLGCDQEVCPRCEWQFISCQCEVSNEMSIYPNK